MIHADNHAIFKFVQGILCVCVESRGVWEDKCSANFKRQLEYVWIKIATFFKRRVSVIQTILSFVLSRKIRICLELVCMKI